MHSDSRWMHKCIRIPVGCVSASGFPDNADQCRFPDKGGGFFRSVVQNGPQIPNLFRSMGYSYNGHYSGLLIRQIRVQIPGGPLTPCLAGRCICQFCQSGLKRGWRDSNPQSDFTDRRFSGPARYQLLNHSKKAACVEFLRTDGLK